MIGDQDTTKVIVAACSEFANLVPLKRFLQQVPSLQPFAGCFQLQSDFVPQVDNKLTIRQSVSNMQLLVINQQKKGNWFLYLAVMSPPSYKEIHNQLTSDRFHSLVQTGSDCLSHFGNLSVFIIRAVIICKPLPDSPLW